MKMDKRLRKYYGLYATSVSERRLGSESVLTPERIVRFARDFDLVPTLCTQVWIVGR